MDRGLPVSDLRGVGAALLMLAAGHGSRMQLTSTHLNQRTDSRRKRRRQVVTRPPLATAEHASMRTEGRAFWTVVLVLCAIAVAASLRRLFALAHPVDLGANPMLSLDALFRSKAALTRTHVIAGLALATFIPLQLSSALRGRAPRVHRWIGRAFLVAALVVAITGYAMVVVPVGGWLEVSAIVVYATAFAGALVVAWRRIRTRDVDGHREWMLRAVSIVLGIATTRPVVAAFFATRRLTGLAPEQFFGVAFWIGFTATAVAGEWYVRRTRSHTERLHGGPGARDVERAYVSSSRLPTTR